MRLDRVIIVLAIIFFINLSLILYLGNVHDTDSNIHNNIILQDTKLKEPIIQQNKDIVNKVHKEIIETINKVDDPEEKIDVVLVVDDKSDLDKVSETIKRSGGKVKRSHKVGRSISAEVPASKVQEVADNNDVDSAWPDREYVIMLDSSVSAMNTQFSWDLNYTGSGIKIAVLDTGIDEDHDIFNNRVILSKTFTDEDHTYDKNGHGSHVAGIAAGNGLYKGVAPDALLINAKVLTDSGSGTTSSIISGINWVVDPDENPETDDGADVIVISFGAPYDDVESPIIQALEDVINMGVVVIISSGNCGVECPGQFCGSFRGVTTPGASEKAITIGSVYDNLNWACFSSGQNFGSYIKPDLVAPGASITSSYASNGYKTMSGTSMSAPHIAGVAALLLQKNNSLSHNEIKNILETNAIDLGDQGKDVYYGSGFVDVEKLFFVPEEEQEEEENKEDEEEEEPDVEEPEENETIPPDEQDEVNNSFSLLIEKDIGQNKFINKSEFNEQDYGFYGEMVEYQNGELYVLKLGVIEFEDDTYQKDFLDNNILSTDKLFVDSQELYFTQKDNYWFWVSDNKFIWILNSIDINDDVRPVFEKYLDKYPLTLQYNIKHSNNFSQNEIKELALDIQECTSCQEGELCVNNDACTDDCDGDSYKEDLPTGTCHNKINSKEQGETYNDERGWTHNDYCIDSETLREYYMSCDYHDLAWCSTQGFYCKMDETFRTDKDCEDTWGSGYVCEVGKCTLGCDYSPTCTDKKRTCQDTVTYKEYYKETACEGNCEGDWLYNKEEDCSSNTYCSGSAENAFPCYSCSTSCDGSCQSSNCYDTDPDCKSNGGTYECCKSSQCDSNEKCSSKQCVEKTCSDYSKDSCSSEGGYRRVGDNVQECVDQWSGGDDLLCWDHKISKGQENFCWYAEKAGDMCTHGEWDCDNDGECASSAPDCVDSNGGACLETECGCCNTGDIWDRSGNICKECTDNSHCNTGQKCVGYQCVQKTCDDFDGNQGSCASGQGSGSYYRVGDIVYKCQSFEGVLCKVKQSEKGDDEFCEAVENTGSKCIYEDFDCDLDSQCDSSAPDCVDHDGGVCFAGNECGCCNTGDVWDESGDKCKECTDNSHCDTGYKCLENKCEQKTCDDFEDNQGSCPSDKSNNDYFRDGDIVYQCQSFESILCKVQQAQKGEENFCWYSQQAGSMCTYGEWDCDNNNECGSTAPDCVDSNGGACLETECGCCNDGDVWEPSQDECRECTEESHCDTGEKCEEYQCVQKTCDDFEDDDGPCASGKNSGDYYREDDTIYKCEDFDNILCRVKQSEKGDDEFCEAVILTGELCILDDYDCDEDYQCDPSASDCVDSDGGICFIGEECGCCKLGDEWDLDSHECKGCYDLDLDDYSPVDGCGQTDCNDTDDDIYPGATETCNGEDDDCDLQIDEDENMCGTYEKCEAGDCIYKTCEELGYEKGSCAGQGLLSSKCFDNVVYDCDDVNNNVLEEIRCYVYSHTCGENQYCGEGSCNDYKCTLTKAYWDKSSVTEGDQVLLTVEGDYCEDTDSARVMVLEVDEILTSLEYSDDANNTDILNIQENITDINNTDMNFSAQGFWDWLPGNDDDVADFGEQYFSDGKIEIEWETEYVTDYDDPKDLYRIAAENDFNNIYEGDLTIVEKCPDKDGDTFSSNQSCGQIDCNDDDDDIYPDAPETCNGEDDDCDLQIDEDENMCGEYEKCEAGDCIYKTCEELGYEKGSCAGKGLLSSKCFDNVVYDCDDVNNNLLEQIPCYVLSHDCGEYKYCDQGSCEDYECVINFSDWQSYDLVENETATLTAYAYHCYNRSAEFEIWESDCPGFDVSATQDSDKELEEQELASKSFAESGNYTVQNWQDYCPGSHLVGLVEEVDFDFDRFETEWPAVYEDDIYGKPDYYFNVIVEDDELSSSDNFLRVTEFCTDEDDDDHTSNPLCVEASEIDCDDDDDDIYPGANEICNGEDEDCDGEIDEGENICGDNKKCYNEKCVSKTCEELDKLGPCTSQQFYQRFTICYPNETGHPSKCLKFGDNYCYEAISLCEENEYCKALSTCPSGQQCDLGRGTAICYSKCDLTYARWDRDFAVEDEIINLYAEGNEHCEGETVNFLVYDTDFFGIMSVNNTDDLEFPLQQSDEMEFSTQDLTRDYAKKQPKSVIFKDGVANTTWKAEWQKDIRGDPEFIFETYILDWQRKRSDLDWKLTVTNRCWIRSIEWLRTEVFKGDQAKIEVIAQGNCQGKEVNVSVGYNIPTAMYSFDNYTFVPVGSFVFGSGDKYYYFTDQINWIAEILDNEISEYEARAGVDDSYLKSRDKQLGKLTIRTKTECPVDDDKDGYISEACEGGTDCNDKSEKKNPGITEKCNNEDDDCDKQVDEGFDLLNDNINCGECGIICGVDESCINGNCVFIAQISLHDYSLSTTQTYPGGTFSLNYLINNPDDHNIGIGLGSTLRDKDFNIVEDATNDFVVNISPGEDWYSRNFVLPDNVAPGYYDVAWGIHSEEAGKFVKMIDSSSPLFSENVLHITGCGDGECKDNENETNCPSDCSIGCTDECTNLGEFFCDGKTIYKCVQNDADNCKDKDSIDYCRGPYGCVSGQGLCKAQEVKTNLRIEDSPNGVVVFKQPGDYITVYLEHKGDEEVMFNYDENNFVLVKGECDNDYINIRTTEECKFIVLNNTGEFRFKLTEGNSEIVKITNNPSIAIVTSRNRLYDRYDQTGEVKQLLRKIYSFAGNNEKEGIVYYLEDYIINDIFNWENFDSYDETLNAYVSPENVYSVEVGRFIADRIGNTPIMILGDDYIVPHYRMNVPFDDYEGKTYTDIAYIQREQKTFSELETLFQYKGEYDNKDVVFIYNSGELVDVEEEINHFKNILESKFNIDYHFKESDEVSCDDYGLFSDFRGSTLIVIGTNVENQAHNCFPFVSSLELENTAFIEKNVWDPDEYTIMINTKEAEMINSLSLMIEKERYKQLDSIGLYYVKVGSDVLAIASLSTALAVTMMASGGTTTGIVLGWMAAGFDTASDLIDTGQFCFSKPDPDSCAFAVAAIIIPFGIDKVRKLPMGQLIDDVGDPGKKIFSKYGVDGAQVIKKIQKAGLYDDFIMLLKKNGNRWDEIYQGFGIVLKHFDYKDIKKIIKTSDDWDYVARGVRNIEKRIGSISLIPYGKTKKLNFIKKYGETIRKGKITDGAVQGIIFDVKKPIIGEAVRWGAYDPKTKYLHFPKQLNDDIAEEFIEEVVPHELAHAKLTHEIRAVISSQGSKLDFDTINFDGLQEILSDKISKNLNLNYNDLDILESFAQSEDSLNELFKMKQEKWSNMPGLTIDMAKKGAVLETAQYYAYMKALAENSGKAGKPYLDTINDFLKGSIAEQEIDALSKTLKNNVNILSQSPSQQIQILTQIDNDGYTIYNKYISAGALT